MGEKDFFIYFDEENRLRERIMTDRGKIMDFVVQYEFVIDNVFVPVVRYDASHGHGHRDLLDSRGQVVEKQWLPSHFDHNQSFTYAESEVRANWPRYRDRFLEKYT